MVRGMHMEFLPKEDLSSFVIRLWNDEDRRQWRGHITHIQSRQETYFLTFDQMVNFISGFFKTPETTRSLPVFTNIDSTS